MIWSFVAVFAGGFVAGFGTLWLWAWLSGPRGECPNCGQDRCVCHAKGDSGGW
jgi:hypothetical protein